MTSASARRPGDVVDARGPRRPRAASSANSSSTSAASAARSASPSDVSQPEDRPHRVADDVVELAGRAALARVALLVMPLILPRRPGGGPAGRARSRPGCRRRRTPPRRPRARAPGDGGTDPGDPVEVADGVLRQPAAPALHVAVDRRGGAARWPPRGRPSDAATSSSSVAWSVGLLAVPAERGAQHEQVVGAPGLAHPVPLGERERGRLDPAAVDRRHEEPGARSTSSATAAARKARVTTAIEAYSIAASSARRRRRQRRQQPGGGRGRGGQHDARRRSRSSGRRGRADDQRRSRAGYRRSARTVASGAHRRTAAVGDQLGAAGPSRRRCRRRRGRRTSAGRRGRSSSRPALGPSRPAAARSARAESSRAWPAYTPPSRGSTSRSTTSSPSRRGDQVADRDVAVEAGGRRRSARDPGQPCRGQHPGRRPAASRSRGTPISERGSGRSAPRGPDPRRTPRRGGRRRARATGQRRRPRGGG